MLKDIVIKGARVNNLKNIDLTIPREKLVVFTGVSGSGKSTLAFDTIFAEGQRRYIESLSSYARMFLGQMSKPDVDSIDGLSPAISIDQKTTSHNPRSTVGTVTEIYDYLRLLFAHVGTPYCPHCGIEIKSQTIDNIVDRILAHPEGTKLMIASPVAKGKKGTFQKEFDDFRKDGFARVMVDGEVYRLDEDIKLDKNKKHDVFVIIDRIIVKGDIQKRVTDSVETSLRMTKGVVSIFVDENETVFSTMHSCIKCGYSLEELAPRMFSFNTPFGACPDCDGLGFRQVIDVSKIIPDSSKSILQNGILASGWAYDNAMSSMFFNAVAKKYNVDLSTPIKKLPKEMLETILYGTKGEKIEVEYRMKGQMHKGMFAFEGIIPNLQRRFRETNSEFVKNEIGKLLVEEHCATCDGKRLKKESLAVKIAGKNIVDVCDMSVVKCYKFFEELELSKNKAVISEPILKEIKSRLSFLKNVGLDYLTLSRLSSTLSGGEAQRIRLATQIGSGLTGVIYILDEPSIGLHQKDNEKLIHTLKNLRDLGNTVIVVEHDEDTMRTADYIVDIGPRAGRFGGEVVAKGTPEEIMLNENSITGQYLSHKVQIPIPEHRRPIKNGYLEIKGAKQNNLKDIDVKIPLGVMTVVTGVSGSGKSSLINDILYPVASNYANRSQLKEGKCDEIIGLEKIDKVINIDQSPIGRTPRSNPATYTNVFTDIRNLFASTNDAKELGYSSSRFSFNISGGRCENCGGAGINKVEMFFLPDMYVVCDECHGKRYNRETLQVKYKGKSIYDVLDMTIEDANVFFENIPKIKNKLQTLVDVGLGYIKLGQPATELSGGEAQRVKLATELCKRSTGKSLYILDEPTTGLHSYDVDKFLKIMNRLVEGGNTAVIIEHNMDVINNADYIIDLGPDGGDKGGNIVAVGTPEEIVKLKKGYTHKYIKLKNM